MTLAEIWAYMRAHADQQEQSGVDEWWDGDEEVG